MKYMMLTYETKEDFAARTDEERKGAYWSGWRSFIGSMQEAGILAYPGNVLQPEDTAVTVKVEGDEVYRSEGVTGSDSFPQLSGYFLIEVTDADEAVRWASLAPAAVTGRIELRPVL
ncbi:YciI family protein [Paenibacillus sp. CC-CFT747]|nr:YciI family protein [Paenibacillus sp. CC-CFT747]